ncbi:hypothetical protein ACEQPO_09380 [Bacillus sp. SL00103]
MQLKLGEQRIVYHLHINSSLHVPQPQEKRLIIRREKSHYELASAAGINRCRKYVSKVHQRPGLWRLYWRNKLCNRISMLKYFTARAP